MQLMKAIEHYMRVLENRRCSPGTLVGYRQVLVLMAVSLDSLCGVTELEQVTVLHLRECVQHLLGDPVPERKHGRVPKNGLTLSPATVGNYIRRYKSFFNWCYREELVEKNPVTRLESPKEDEVVLDPFTGQQIEQMIGVFDLSTPLGFRDYVIILLMLDTGLRRAEVSTLKVGDVYETYISALGKGRKERHIGIHPNVSNLLWKYINKHRKPLKEDETALFLSVGRGYAGRPLGYGGVHHVMERLRKATGIDDVRLSSHTFRHTFACMYLDEGGDLFSLSREMGHTDVKTTERYFKGFTSRNANKHHAGHSPINRIKLRSTRKSRGRSQKPEKE